MSGAGKKWDDRQKYHLVVKVLAQIGGGLDNIHPNFETIDLDGRTAKAMTLMWDNIKNEFVTGGTSGGEAAVSATSAKRKADDNAAGTSNIKKRNTGKGKKKGRKLKDWEESEEEDIPMPDLHEDDPEDEKPVFVDFLDDEETKSGDEA